MHATCLNGLTDLCAIWQVHLWGQWNILFSGGPWFPPTLRLAATIPLYAELLWYSMFILVNVAQQFLWVCSWDVLPALTVVAALYNISSFIHIMYLSETKQPFWLLSIPGRRHISNWCTQQSAKLGWLLFWCTLCIGGVSFGCNVYGHALKAFVNVTGWVAVTVTAVV